jgi:hypothetical protein
MESYRSQGTAADTITLQRAVTVRATSIPTAGLRKDLRRWRLRRVSMFTSTDGTIAVGQPEY